LHHRRALIRGQGDQGRQEDALGPFSLFLGIGTVGDLLGEQMPEIRAATRPQKAIDVREDLGARPRLRLRQRGQRHDAGHVAVGGDLRAAGNVLEQPDRVCLHGLRLGV
jgi:hypothetical protein